MLIDSTYFQHKVLIQWKQTWKYFGIVNIKRIVGM